MRRILDKKSVDKSSEKKKRDALINSIAVEEQSHFALKEIKKEIEKDVDTARKEKKTALERAEFYKKNADDAEKQYNDILGKLIPLQSEIGIITDRISKLLEEEVSLRTLLRVAYDEYTKEKSRMTNESEKEINEYTRRKLSLAQEISGLEARVDILTKSESQISGDIESKKREQTSMDTSLALRMTELAQINLNLSQSRFESERAEKELSEIGGKILALQADITNKDAEIREKNEEVSLKEKEVESRREEIVALMQRSKKIDEKAQAVKDLFQMAGLNIDI